MTTSHEGWVARLRKALQDGKPLDLSGIKGAREWPEDPAARKWPKGATIPASALREVLVRPGVEVDPRGLTIVGARVAGEIDLDNVVVGFAFGLVGCRLDEPFNARHSSWQDLAIAESQLPALTLDSSGVDGSLFMSGLKATGEVTAIGVSIAGQVVLRGADLANEGGDALVLDGARVGGDAFLDGGFVSLGKIRAPGALIAGDLSLSGAHLRNAGDAALDLNGISTGGDLHLNDGFRVSGEVRALGATISGQLNLSGAHLRNKNGKALSLDGATISGGAFLSGGFRAEGEVRALSATIAKQLTLDGASIRNRAGDALSLDGARIDGSARLSEGFTALGQVRALGTTFSGQVNLGGALLSNEGGQALNLDRANVGGDLFLNNGFGATGEVRALGVTISGQLNLKGANVSNPNAVAVNLDGATIGGGLLGDGLRANGEVRALGAAVSGQLSLGNAELSNSSGNALSLDGARISGEVRLDGRFTARGRVRAPGISVTGQLSLVGARIAHEGNADLILQSARVELLLLGTSEIKGLTILNDAEVGCLVSRPLPHRLPEPVSVDGLRVSDIQGFIRSDGRAMREWLDARPSNVPFSPGPWVRMADLYRANGHPEIARRLRYEAARRTTKSSPWRSKTLRRMYQVTVGFGHYPWITGFWLAGVFASSALLAHFAGDSFTKVTPTAPGTFSAWSIAIETAIPAAGTLGATDWVSTTHWVTWTLAGLRVIAWVMTALMLAGVTGLLKKAD